MTTGNHNARPGEREDTDKLVTVGQLAARTGLSIKAIREFEGRGLIYTAGRSPSNYRLFDESALWCAHAICNLRSLGLTIKEIEALADVYLNQPEQPIGPRLAAMLERAERRIDERIRELETARQRIRAYRAAHPDVREGMLEGDRAEPDPRGGTRAA